MRADLGRGREVFGQDLQDSRMGKIDRKRRSSVLLKGPLYHDLQPVAYNIARIFSTWSIMAKKRHIPPPPTSRPRTTVKASRPRSPHHLVCAAPFFSRTDHPPKTLIRNRNTESACHSAVHKRLTKYDIEKVKHALPMNAVSTPREAMMNVSLGSLSIMLLPSQDLGPYAEVMNLGHLFITF